MAVLRWSPAAFTGARTGIILAALVLPRFTADTPEQVIDQAASVVARATGGVVTPCPSTTPAVSGEPQLLAARSGRQRMVCVRSPGAPYEVVEQLDTSLRNRWSTSWRAEQYRDVPVNAFRHQGQLLGVSAERAAAGTLLRLQGAGTLTAEVGWHEQNRPPNRETGELPVIPPLATRDAAPVAATTPAPEPTPPRTTPDSPKPATTQAPRPTPEPALPPRSTDTAPPTTPRSPVQAPAPPVETPPPAKPSPRNAAVASPQDSEAETPLPPPEALPAPPATLRSAPQESASGNLAQPDTLRPPADRPSEDTFTRALSLSEPRLTGEDVRRVQNRLMDVAGMARGPGGDGWYGPTTERTVRAFQEANGLSATGTVDRATWERLFSEQAQTFAVRAAETPPAPQTNAQPPETKTESPAPPAETTGGPDNFVRELSLGEPRMHGEDVRRVQNRLVDVAGMPRGSGGDGWYGPRTQATVRAFQQANGLPVTGVVDQATWKRLFSGTARAFAQADVEAQQ